MAKRIGAIVSLSLIGVLIIATIIMANVSVNYKIYCNDPKYVYVQYQSNSDVGTTQEQKDAIVNYINNASSEKSLIALFNGNLNNYAEVVKENGSLPKNLSFYVRYVYENEQTLKLKKKDYKDSEGKTYGYTELVFTVTQEQGKQTRKVYVITDSSNPDEYNFYYNLDADFEELYNYLNSNFNE